MNAGSPVVRCLRTSRVWQGEAVAIQAHRYSRSPLDPFPAERACHHPAVLPSAPLTAWAAVSLPPSPNVRRKFEGTRST